MTEQEMRNWLAERGHRDAMRLPAQVVPRVFANAQRDPNYLAKVAEMQSKPRKPRFQWGFCVGWE